MIKNPILIKKKKHFDKEVFSRDLFIKFKNQNDVFSYSAFKKCYQRVTLSNT